MIAEAIDLRLLMLHSNYFRYEAVEKTRFSEEAGEDEKSGNLNKPVLVVFVCSENLDEKDPLEVAKKSAEEIIDIARQVKAKNVVLHSFAHLSTSLSSPNVARKIINEMHRILTSMGYNSIKTPFGWRDSFELRVKSHPISKVSRTVLPSSHSENREP